ncbi:hypothetical protein B0H14DRAFT_3696414 [Mycena olivaceomarginata]|nr:hypothetical protein B0H14DRAFT_3696414 [Mycena olivaceomarginata]
MAIGAAVGKLLGKQCETGHDNEYYHSTGDSVIRIENTLFKVHKLFLTYNSAVFATLFDLPGETGRVEGLSDDLPIVLEGETSENFRIILKYVYARRSTSRAGGTWPGVRVEVLEEGPVLVSALGRAVAGLGISVGPGPLGAVLLVGIVWVWSLLFHLLGTAPSKSTEARVTGEEGVPLHEGCVHVLDRIAASKDRSVVISTGLRINEDVSKPWLGKHSNLRFLLFTPTLFYCFSIPPFVLRCLFQ